ncbi:MAG TPA: hypothetical protein VGM97_00445 [Steroidobacteraceae bacterium]
MRKAALCVDVRGVSCGYITGHPGNSGLKRLDASAAGIARHGLGFC